MGGVFVIAVIRLHTVAADQARILAQDAQAPTAAILAEAVPIDHPEPEQECAICMQLLTTMESAALKCGHAFHVSCMLTWTEKVS